MEKQDRSCLETILNAASETGWMGTSASHRALINLARCSMCAFRTSCEGAQCVLLVSVAEPARLPPIAVKPARR